MQRSTRYFGRSNTMTREKRGLDSSENEEHQPEQKKQKVPALANVIVEALKVDSLQKLFSSLEPILRRVVSEEVERALAKLGPARLGGRSSPKRIEGPDGRNLQLHFKSQLSLPIFTGGKVEGEQGSAIHVVLLDSNTGQVVTSGPESSVKLDIVVLEGDFNKEDDDGWTEEDFESHVVKEREGKRPLLTGDLQVSLKEGVGTLGELTFTDNSSWIRSRKFRLGLKVTSGFCEGIRVREAKTDAFTVKDHRGELYKKHYPPNFNDDVWRLEKIGKDGAFHKRLNKAGIYTVEEFLRFMVKDSAKLRSILGSGMSNKMWEGAIEHAKTCILSGKLYVYYTDETRNIGVVFNNIYELNGLIMSGQYHRAERLSDSEKVFVDTLVKKAYDNWMNVIEYDGKAFLGLQQNKKMIRGEVAMCLADYPNAYDQQAPLQRLPLPIPAEQTYMGAALTGAGGMVSSSGYNESPASRYPAHTQHVTSDTQIHYDNGVSFVPQNQLSSSSSHQTQLAIRDPVVGLALGSAQTISLGIQSMAPSAQSSNVNNQLEDWSRYRDTRAVEDIFSVDEIRARSSEMLDTEDMQHLLRFINMGGPSVHGTDDGYYPDNSYVSSPMPDYSFDEDRSRSSGKAVVGWLKLKAALRWGIFIRKIAAEKRARLVELDD